MARRVPKRRITVRLTFDLPDAAVSLNEVERRLGEQLDRQRPSIRRQIKEQLTEGKVVTRSPPPEGDGG